MPGTENDTALVIIDVQEKLTAVMPNQESLIRGLTKIVTGAQLLQMPILWIEQNPTRMGPTIAPLRKCLPSQQPIAKMSFSCCGAPEFSTTLVASGCRHVLIAGIETHVCIYQTARDLMQQDYHVQVVVDAVSSRNSLDHDVALQRINDMAARKNMPMPCITAEAALFEHMQSADHPCFRDILKVIR